MNSGRGQLNASEELDYYVVDKRVWVPIIFTCQLQLSKAGGNGGSRGRHSWWTVGKHLQKRKQFKNWDGGVLDASLPILYLSVYFNVFI